MWVPTELRDIATYIPWKGCWTLPQSCSILPSFFLFSFFHNTHLLTHSSLSHSLGKLDWVLCSRSHKAASRCWWGPGSWLLKQSPSADSFRLLAGFSSCGCRTAVSIPLAAGWGLSAPSEAFLLMWLPPSETSHGVSSPPALNLWLLLTAWENSGPTWFGSLFPDNLPFAVQHNYGSYSQVSHTLKIYKVTGGHPQKSGCYKYTLLSIRAIFPNMLFAYNHTWLRGQHC